MEISSTKMVEDKHTDKNFKVKLEKGLEESFVCKSGPDGSSSLKIKQENVESEEQKNEHLEFTSQSDNFLYNNFKCKDECGEMFGLIQGIKTETQNDELYSKALNDDENFEMFDEFCEHKDEMETNIESDVSIHNNLNVNEPQNSNKQLKLQCEFCDKSFSKKVSMDDHLANCHPEISESKLNSLIIYKVYTCNICSYSTTQKSTLLSHKITHRDQQLKIKCKFCDEEFVKKASMEDHLLKQHTELSETDLKGLITSKVLKCQICPYKTTHKHCLDLHIDTKHSEKQLKCNFCDETFVKKVSMDSHLLKQHPELTKSDLNSLITSSVYRCQTCSYSTTHKRSLDRHNMIHRDQRLKIKCKFCDESFIKKVSMENHIIKHHADQSETNLKGIITSKVFTCKICPYKTMHKHRLNSHNNTKHSKEQLKCNFCQKVFAQKISLDDHLIKHHPEMTESNLNSLITNKVYTCNICSYSTTVKGNLHIHIRTHSDQRLKIKCKFCDEEFIKKISMEDHLLKHHTELSETDLKGLITSKVFTCEFCPYKTMHKHSLDGHNNTKHSKEQLKCNFCEKVFAQKISMDDHLLKHHPESNLNSLITNKVYTCQICSYSTTHKSNLHIHNITHSDQRLKIKCKFCDQEFVKKVSMEDHLLKHHTELSETDLKGLITSKVLTCKICSYKTTHKSCLNSHVNTKHRKKQ